MPKSEYKKVVADKKSAKMEILKLSSESHPMGKKDGEAPLLVVFAPTSGFSREHFYQLLEGLLILPSQVVVISDDEHADAEDHIRGKFSWINTKEGRNAKSFEKFLLAADMALVFDEHMADMKKLLDNGVVVVGSERSPFLENYKPNEETGNSFTFDTMNPWDIFRSLVRAHETYMFPYDWGNIVRSLLKQKA